MAVSPEYYEAILNFRFVGEFDDAVRRQVEAIMDETFERLANPEEFGDDAARHPIGGDAKIRWVLPVHVDYTS